MGRLPGGEEEPHLVQEVPLPPMLVDQLGRPCVEANGLRGFLHPKLIIEEDVDPNGGFDRMVDAVVNLLPDVSDHMAFILAASTPSHHSRVAVAEISANIFHRPDHGVTIINKFMPHNIFYKFRKNIKSN